MNRDNFGEIHNRNEFEKKHSTQHTAHSTQQIQNKTMLMCGLGLVHLRYDAKEKQ